MDFIVDEAGCRRLSMDMLENMKGIATLVSYAEENDDTLKVALGDDYMAIATSVNYIKNELQLAEKELNIIIEDMNEYIARVKQARVALEE